MSQNPCCQIVIWVRLLANTDLDARILIASGQIDDALDSVVAAVASFSADAHFANIQRNIIKYYNDMLRTNFIKLACFPNCLTGIVHIGRWLHQHDLFPFDFTHSVQGFEFELINFASCLLCNAVNCHKSGVVAGCIVFRLWISQTYHQKFRCSSY